MPHGINKNKRNLETIIRIKSIGGLCIAEKGDNSISSFINFLTIYLSILPLGIYQFIDCINDWLASLYSPSLLFLHLCKAIYLSWNTQASTRNDKNISRSPSFSHYSLSALSIGMSTDFFLDITADVLDKHSTIKSYYQFPMKFPSNDISQPTFTQYSQLS